MKKEPPKESVGQKSGPPKMEQNLEVLFKSSLVGRRIRTQIQNILTVTFLFLGTVQILSSLSNAITSMRQAAEWGMGAVEKVYRRLTQKLP